MVNKYNYIAPFYKVISKLIYGNQLLKIQSELIKKLPLEEKICILGGGNGDILPLIYEHAPQLEIEYIDTSSRMIALAKQKIHPLQRVQFYHLDAFQINLKSKHIYAGFFLDQFNENVIQSLIQKFESKNNQIWYVADFQLTKDTEWRFFRKIQLTLTILFFRLTTQHSLSYLPKIKAVFKKLNYSAQSENSNNSFLFWAVFQKDSG